MKSILQRFESRFTKTNGCWIWRGYADAPPNDYGRLNIRGKFLRTHRIAYELYRGPIPEGMCVLHTCDTPSCVNPDHLWVGTHQDNMDDRGAKGRTDRKGKAKGFAHYKAKLTPMQIAAIKMDSRIQHVVAKDYGISQQTVSRIRCGQRWNWVNG